MDKARRLHAYLIKTRLDSDPVALRHLFHLSCSQITTAAGAAAPLSYIRDVFHLLPYTDTFCYNMLIKAHSHHPLHAPHALSLFTLMRRSSVPLDHFTFPFLLKSCSHLRTGTELHALVIKLGFSSFIHVRNALIHLYGCCGFVRFAVKLFDEMPERDKDVVSWTSLISCFANNGFWAEALRCFQQMQLVGGIKPDEVTMIGVLSAVSSLGALELGRWVEGYVKRNGLKLTVPLGTALIDMYSRCGAFDESVKVFDEMPERSVATWTALINGLAVHGRSKEALRIFYEMKGCGMRPDHITFRAVLVACSHGGLVDEGRAVFDSIKSDCNAAPTLEHYGCMVDLLGRAGLLYEAFEFVKKMPIRPNGVIWRTLLGACVIHNRLDLAEKAKGRISELDPDHDGDYVLLSNAYGGVGRWHEKANTRNSMKDRRISKVPGYSFLNVNQVIHEFVSGDDSHPKSKEIKEFLASTINRLRVKGYAPHTSNVLYDIEEEEKEHSLSYHSEKLAVAFSLTSFRDRKKIRVMKNLRICHDCHSFMKHVSCEFGVEIIIRDRTRFHHFSEGSCSCKDYW